MTTFNAHINFISYAAGFNIYALYTLTTRWISDKIMISETRSKTILNDQETCKSIIKSLHQTYSPKKDILLYGRSLPTPGSISIINRKKIQAYALGNQTILLYAVIQTALEDSNDPLHLAAKGIIGHEMGHIVHNHHKKIYLVNSIAALFTFYAAHKFLVSNIMGCSYKPLKIVGIFVIKNGVDKLIEYAYSRRTEREADHHLITSTQDPAILEATAAFFEEQAKSQPAVAKQGYFDLGSWFDPHPSSPERALCFKEAANKLKEAANKPIGGL